MSDLATLVVSFASDLSGLTSGAQKAKEEIQSVETATKASSTGFLGSVSNMVSGFGSGISSMISHAISFGSQLGMTFMGLQGLTQTVVGFGKALFGSDASMEQTRVAFIQLLGSSKAADAQLKDMAKFAADTPFEFPDIADATQKLLAFQIPLKDTKPLLTAIGDALSGLGANTPATLQQVVNVFGQMNAAGKIQTQDLMQLTSVGINGFAILADQMHKPIPVIKEMVTSGLIPAKDGIEMLRAGMEKTFGGGMKAQSQTFLGLLSTIQDNIGAMWRSFTGPLFDMAKGGLQKIGDLVSSPAFQGFATGAGAAIANIFGSIGNIVRSLVSPAIEHLGGAFSELGAFVEVATEPFRDEAIGIALGGFKDLGQTIMNAVAPAFQSLSGALSSGGFIANFRDLAIVIQHGLTDALYNLPDVLNMVAGSLKPVADLIGGGLKIGLQTAKDLFQAISPGIQQVASIIAGQFKNDLKWLGTTFQQIGGWVNSSLLPAIAQLEPPFKTIAGAIASNVMPALARLWAIGHQVAEKFLTPLIGILEAIIPPVLAVGGFVGGLLADAFSALSPIVGGLVDVIGDLINFFTQTEIGGDILKATLIALAIPVGALTIAMIQLAIEGLVAFIASIPEMVGGFLAGAAAAWTMAAGVIAATWPILALIAVIVLIILAIQHWGQIVDWLKAAWNAIVGFFVGLFNGIVNFFKQWGVTILEILTGPVGWIIMFWKPITQFFQNIWNGITKIFSVVGRWFGDRFTQAWSAITSVFSKAATWFHDHVWQPIVDKFTTVFSGLKNIAAGIWSGIISGVKWAFNQVIGFINGGIDKVNAVTGLVHVPPIPHIPYLHSGGFVEPGAFAIAGDPGPNQELVYGGKTGATVFSHAQSLALLNGGGGGGSPTVHVHNYNSIYLDGQEISDAVGAQIVSRWLNHGSVRSAA